MHILLAILGVMGVAAFWWYRLKFMGQAANEVADAVGRVQGNIRRSKLRKKAALAPITAIDNPVTAAATVIMAIAAEDVPVSEALERRVRAEIAGIAETDRQIDEAVIYAKWASDQVADVATVIDKASLFLATRLNVEEKEELVQMVLSASPPGERHAMFGRRLEQLRRRLGLVVER
jgi:NADH dehydrogenase/NADH:ubiquinone oxidoreductase subunit G